MSGNNVSSAANQQGTAYKYYFSGFITGEGSFSIIKASNVKVAGGFYYTPDITVSNADISLLREINKNVFANFGITSKIKGGFNLSLRGKAKVKVTLDFLRKYPPITGDLVKNKIQILKEAVEFLTKNRRWKRLKAHEQKVERFRKRLKLIKSTAKPEKKFKEERVGRVATGYFLSGITDAEGSVGLRRNYNYYQPYFAVLMKDEKVIRLFRKFFGFGHIYYRPKSKLYHFETGKRSDVAKICDIFLYKYPVRLLKMKQRMKKVSRILNDYMPRSQPDVGM